MKLNRKQVDGLDAVFMSYPAPIAEKLVFLRQLVIDTASEIDTIDELEETLKWGEPSYLAQGGSTLRLGWKASNPDQYALYFHCKTTLIETFKELYYDTFRFQDNRAIVFDLKDEIAVEALKHCIELSLTYHARKHLPLLGA